MKDDVTPQDLTALGVPVPEAVAAIEGDPVTLAETEAAFAVAYFKGGASIRTVARWCGVRPADVEQILRWDL